jgi:HK97 gp10 family phage protein
MADAASVDLISLAADFASASKIGIAQAAQEVIRTAAQTIQQEAQSLAPVKSGRLRSSISIRYPNPLEAVVGPQVEYGKYQEFGTGERGEFGGSAYTIKPKKPGGVLVFKIGGKTVYARSVRHPGIPAHPYMRPALEKVLGDMTGSLAAKGALLIAKGPNA